MNSLNKKSIKDLDVNGKTIVLHLDLNVVVDYENKRILNDRKLRASLPTINYLINHNAKIVILSHLGRIKTLADKQSGKYSLEIIVDELRNRVSKNVNRVVFSPLNYGETVVQMVNDLEERDILILENTRYCDISDEGEYVGLEWDGSEILGQFWGMLGDIFIDDAYGVAHRQLSSNYQTAKFAKKSALGFLIVNEINHLDIALEVPKSPYLALIGGNRVADKIAAIEVLCERADQVIIGGGLVYTFLYAQGYNVGLNLVERNMIDDCNNILEKYGKKILICFDFLCNNDFSDTIPTYPKIDEGLQALYGVDICEIRVTLMKRDIAVLEEI
ncbi:phosphoglycerate kinase, partial [Ureaplasma urealyticum]